MADKGSTLTPNFHPNLSGAGNPAKPSWLEIKLTNPAPFLDETAPPFMNDGRNDWLIAGKLINVSPEMAGSDY